MAIQITCAHCAKSFRVDGKFGGKKVRCKNCNEAISVPAENAVIASASAPAKNIVAKVSASKPASPKPVAKTVAKVAPKPTRTAHVSPPKPTGPQPEALDLPNVPDLSDLSDDGSEIVLGSDMEVGAPAGRRGSIARSAPSVPSCPGCQRPMRAESQVCMGCGYRRPSARQVQPLVARELVEERSGGAMSRTGFGGTRLWTDYENPFLRVLDSLIPNCAMILFLLMGVFFIVAPILAEMAGGRGVHPGGVFASILFIVVGMAMFYFVVLHITMYGVKIAASSFNFEVPEDGPNRLMGSHMVAFAVSAVVFFVGSLIAGAGVQLSPTAGTAAAAFGGVFLVSLITYLTVSFACFTLLFHMRVVEAIVGYLLMVLFYMIGWAVNVVVLLILLFILGSIMAGVMGPMPKA
jgi:hypothetical protein